MVRTLLPMVLLLGGCLPTGRTSAGGRDGPSLSGNAVRRPRLTRSFSKTTEEFVRIEGYATPGHRIELYVNSLLAGETVARSDGRFQFPRIRLRQGQNVITATAVDSLGNRSESRPGGGGARVGSESQRSPELRIQRQ